MQQVGSFLNKECWILSYGSIPSKEVCILDVMKLFIIVIIMLAMYVRMQHYAAG